MVGADGGGGDAGMPILTLQRRATELGRIRIGVRQPAAGGKTRPAKLDTFRFTSPSRALIEAAAGLYGGTVAPWSPNDNAAGQWEVVSTASVVPILVPPDPVTQWFEHWSGGGCLRRCDGQTETLTGKACLCDPDPQRRLCKPTSRLCVVLRDMPGIGVWRLETHGYYAAVELPALAEFLADADGYIPARLTVRERTTMRDGKTLRYMVPGIEVDVTPAALMAGRVDTRTALPPATTSPAPPVAALPAGNPPPRVRDDVALWVDTLSGVQDMATLTAVYEDARSRGLCADMGDVDDPVVAAFLATRDRLREAGRVAVPHATIADVAAAAVTVELPPAGDGEAGSNDKATADDLWYSIISGAPDGMSVPDIEHDFRAVTGVSPADAGVTHMRRYLQKINKAN